MKTLHKQLAFIVQQDGTPQKHLDMWEALKGQGELDDFEITENLSADQCKSITLEYIKKLYIATGN